MKEVLSSIRKFAKENEIGEATEEQGLEILKSLAPHLDEVKDIEGKDLAYIADLFVGLGEIISHRAMESRKKDEKRTFEEFGIRSPSITNDIEL